MSIRRCERSEAIQKAARQELDCFVAVASRNDEDQDCGPIAAAEVLRRGIANDNVVAGNWINRR